MPREITISFSRSISSVVIQAHVGALAVHHLGGRLGGHQADELAVLGGQGLDQAVEHDGLGVLLLVEVAQENGTRLISPKATRCSVVNDTIAGTKSSVRG
jgi:hypothetical protein